MLEPQARRPMSRREGPVREPQPETLPRAVEAARSWLLAAQEVDGHWCGELEGDTILESEYVLVLHFLGRLGDPQLGKLARYLRDKQLPQGGWAIYPGGPAEVSGSVKAYLALKLAGDDPEAPHMRLARQRIRGLGGIEACNTFTKIYLALCGEYDWWSCPAVPPEMILLPRWFYFNLYEISSWSRAIVVPLSVIWALRPVRPLPEGRGVAELRVAAAEHAAARLGPSGADGHRPRLGGASHFWRGFFLLLDRALKAGEKARLRPLRRRALARAEAWIRERLADSDGLGAIFPPIVNTVFALCCLGYPKDHPLVVAQMAELERLAIEENGGLRLQPCFSSVWDTALAVHALADSGLPGDHPALVRAKRWLLEHEIRRTGDWSVKAPGAPPGGWCFEYRNPFYPDCDDTAEVLTALSTYAGRAGGQAEPAARRGLAWLLAMQNEDGGWGAFDRACDKEILTYVPFADHNALLDPSTADVTGRVLDCLFRCGLGGERPEVARAISWLRGEQEEDGSWYGRWGCNYIYGTWLALRGLARYPEQPEQPEQPENGGIAGEPWCRKAVAWLISCQNPDGGWGESPLSYDDPSQKGCGESTAAQTAWALMALFGAAVVEGPAVERGIGFLVRSQRQDGCWRDEPWTATGFPRVFYLRYHLYATYFPLMVLSEYLRLRRGVEKASSPALKYPQAPQQVCVRRPDEGAAR
jgi:squalene-hopene/tetraprenyl-beta-curcumene cyclase